MIVLNAGQQVQLYGNYATAYWSGWGSEIVNGVPQYKTLFTGGPLAAASTFQTIYQVPTGRTAFISHIVLNTGSSNAVVIFMTAGGVYIAYSLPISPNGWNSYDGDGWHIYDAISRRYS